MDDHRPDDGSDPSPDLGPLARLSDRLGTSIQSVVAGALAVLAAAGAAWWALRPPAPPPVESILPAAGTVAVHGAPTTTTVVVHVGGEVARPGMHELESGARVVDAILAAGGVTELADDRRLNLAAPIVDGQRVWIPAEGEDETPVVVGEPPSDPDRGSGPAGPIDVNQADAGALESLPGIGPALAAAIIEHRARTGPFRVVDDLLDVTGIGPAKLAQLRGLVST